MMHPQPADMRDLSTPEQHQVKAVEVLSAVEASGGGEDVLDLCQ